MIAPETDNARTSSVATTVALRSAKRPKLTKMMTNQKTSITRNSIGMEPPLCSKSNQRMCPRPAALLAAVMTSGRSSSHTDTGLPTISVHLLTEVQYGR